MTVPQAEFLDFGWRDLVAVLTAATLIGGMVIAWVRWQLSTDFAKRGDITGLSDRMERVEAALKSFPSLDDVRALGERVGRVERGVEVVSAHLEGVRDGQKRIETDLRLLIQHHIGAIKP